MSDRGDLLREVMHETRTTQTDLARLSGIRQPSISQFLSGKVDLSDDQLDRLLSCMGYRLEVTRRPVAPILTRPERRSWRLHCRLALRLINRLKSRPAVVASGMVTGADRAESFDMRQNEDRTVSLSNGCT